MRPLLNVLGFALFWLVFIAATLGGGLLLFVPYCLLVFRNQEARAAKAGEKLRAAVMDGESVVHSALQLRVAALTARRLTIAVTSSRIIVVTRSLLGGFTMKDYQWKDLTDVQLAENVMPQWFGARLAFATGASGGSLEIDGIASDSASAIYRHAQAQELAWEEKRRVRQLEEVRAASGGVVMNAGVPAGAAANDGKIGAAVDELERVKRLLDSGAISDVEYQEIKAKVLGRVAG
jgi:hypothetical protein